MTAKRVVCALIAICLALPVSGALATQPQTTVIDRRISSNEAKSLANLPEAARLRTDSLVIGVPDLYGEFNPFWAITTGDDSAAALMFDELLFTDNTGDAGPGVATFTQSTDKKTCTFTLRDNVAYVDGTPISSDDFINALYLLLNPEYDGIYDITRANIVGAEAYLSGEAASVSGIERISEKAFSVTTMASNPETLLFFAIPALRLSLFGDMRRPETLTSPVDFTAFYAASIASVRGLDASAMAYGQYALTSLEPGVRAVFQKHTGYWRGEPYIGGVELLVVPTDPHLAFASIIEGTVDIVSVMGSTGIVDESFAAGFINLYTWDGDVLGFLGFDLENALFAERGVREALAAGIDRTTIHQKTVERYGKTPDMLLFDSFSSRSPTVDLQILVYDKERAMRLLEDAGWTLSEDNIRYRGGKPFAFTLSYNLGNPIMDTAAPLIQAAYKELGVEMKIETLPLEALTERIENNECDMYFEARRLPNSAAIAADLFAGDSHLNQSGFHSEMLDKYLQQAAMESDPDRSNVYYEVLYQELFAEMSFIPLYRRGDLLLISGRVMNALVTTSHAITSDVYRFFLVDTLEGQW